MKKGDIVVLVKEDFTDQALELGIWEALITGMKKPVDQIVVTAVKKGMN